MKRSIKTAFVIVAILAGVGGGSAWWAVRKTQQVPDFYVQAKKRMPADLAAASKELEHDVSELQGAVANLGSWQAVFSEEQINAWLVEQLPKEFPKVLPVGVADPRIVIEDDRVLAAATYKSKHIDTVVSFEIKVALTEHANVIALRIENLRAGSLPLPLQSFLRGISTEAAKGDIKVVWDMDEKGPVALVTVPSDHPRYKKTPVIVESFQLLSGQVLLAGHTGPEAWHVYRPRGVVYQLASVRSRRTDNCQSVPSPSARVR